MSGARPTGAAATSGTDAGTEVRRHTALHGTPLSLDAAHSFVADPGAGATVTFTGVVRDHAPDTDDRRTRSVAGLEYSAYEEVAAVKLGELADELAQRWPDLRAIWLEHRTGALEVGEVAVVVAVSSPHRHTAFDAGRHGIDTLKATVPIWKHERWADGGAHWPGTD